MRTRAIVACAALTSAACLSARAQPVDFFTFTDWQGGFYPLANDFVIPLWDIRDGGATTVAVGNVNPSIFYSDAIDLNGKRITGTIMPGQDDDLVGIAFGYTAADDFNPTAKWWIIDWKALDQSFSFFDQAANPPGTGTFHDITPYSTLCASGMRLLECRGTPTAAELWSGRDLPENDNGIWAPGGVEEVARAQTLRRLGYDRSPGAAYQVDLDLTPTNLKLWVNGVLQFDIDAPPGEPFETLGFGVVEQYQHTTANPDEVLFTNFSIADSPGTPPAGPGLTYQPPTTAFTGGLINPGSTSGSWELAITTPANPLQIITPPNTGDVAFHANGNALYHFDGVALATTRQNGVGSLLTTTEAAIPSTGFAGVSGAIAGATNRSPSGAETNVPFAIGYFPFAEGWIGGVVAPSGTFFDNVYNAAVTQRVSPDVTDQNGLFDVVIPGASPADGILFTCSTSNEDNVTAAIPLGAGWRIAVRDNGDPTFGGPETFENDDFGFLYIPAQSTPSRIIAAASVTGFDINNDAITALSVGAFTLAAEQAGLYRLTIPGVTPFDGMLLLTANSQITLADPLDELDNDAAPLNHYLTYEADGDDFLIQQVQLDGATNPRLNGPFSFAFVSFADSPACVCEVDGDAGQVNVFDLLAYLDLWFPGNAGADIDGAPGVDVFDLLFFLDCWFPASAGSC